MQSICGHTWGGVGIPHCRKPTVWDLSLPVKFRPSVHWTPNMSRNAVVIGALAKKSPVKKKVISWIENTHQQSSCEKMQVFISYFLKIQKFVVLLPKKKPPEKLFPSSIKLKKKKHFANTMFLFISYVPLYFTYTCIWDLFVKYRNKNEGVTRKDKGEWVSHRTKMLWGLNKESQIWV